MTREQMIDEAVRRVLADKYDGDKEDFEDIAFHPSGGWWLRQDIRVEFRRIAQDNAA